MSIFRLLGMKNGDLSVVTKGPPYNYTSVMFRDTSGTDCLVYQRDGRTEVSISRKDDEYDDHIIYVDRELAEKLATTFRRLAETGELATDESRRAALIAARETAVEK